MATILNEAAEKSAISVTMGAAFEAFKQKFQIKPLKLPFVTCMDLTLRWAFDIGWFMPCPSISVKIDFELGPGS